MPVCYSLFDRESAAECFAELLAHPRVARGRCKLAAVGMRIDSRTKGEAALRQWADALQLPFLGALRETQTYVKCLEHGLTVFDMPAAKVEVDLAQWQPILDWVAPLLAQNTPVGADDAKPVRKPTRPVLPPGSLPSGNLRPVAESAESELAAARTVPGTLDPLPAHVPDAVPTQAVARDGAAPKQAAEPATPPKIHRLVPVSADEDLDSRFGGLTTRIGRWLELVSLKRAR